MNKKHKILIMISLLIIPIFAISGCSSLKQDNVRENLTYLQASIESVDCYHHVICYTNGLNSASFSCVSVDGLMRECNNG